MKKLLTKALMLAAILGFTSAATFAKDYADLPKDHWAYKQIQILTDFNVVVGYPDGNYKPMLKRPKKKENKELKLSDLMRRA
jgi:hypothetical protein